MRRWNALSSYFFLRFGRRVQKIPLDAGFSCPNRDGTLSTAGCVFCNEHGSGSGLGLAGMDIATQWDYWHEHYRRTHRQCCFIAYFQSFSNTYGPAEKLKKLIKEVCELREIVGISVGTRPDCLDKEKLEIIAASNLPEIWLELGVQSCHNRTLEKIRRGHTIECAAQTIRDASAAGLKVCVHLMAGLPGESSRDFLDAIDWVNSLPIQAVKIHEVYVCRNTELARWYAAGQYIPLEEHAYIDLLVQALSHLAPHIVVQRLVGDPSEEELLAPDWAADKQNLVEKIHQAMENASLWQGIFWEAERQNTHVASMPLWFTPYAELPAHLRSAWQQECTTLYRQHPWYAHL